VNRATPLQRLSGTLLGVLWVLVVVDLLSGLSWVRPAAMACLAGFLLCAVPRASSHIRVLSFVTALAAAWAVVRMETWAPVRAGLQAGVIFGAFIPTIMLLRATADESPLLQETRGRIDAWSEPQRELWVQGVCHLIGSFLMIGGYVIARSALPKELDERARVRLAESATRGLGLAVCWSPFFVSSAIASQLVPSIAAWKLVVLGLGFAALGWALSSFFFRGVQGPALGAALRAAAAFALPSAFLVALVIALSVATGLRNLEAVVLLIPVVCVLYLLKRGGPSLRRAFGRVPPTLARLSDEVIVITMAMCLGAVVGSAHLGEGMSSALAALGGVPSLLIAAEVALIAALGFAGVHPMITATLLLPLLSEAHRGVADLVLAYVVVFAWALSAMVAIWTLPVASSATTFAVPVRRLALGRNLPFVIAFGGCGCVALALLNRALTG
jgi:hypothetical protein